MAKFKVRNIFIGSLGTIRIEIPLLVFGTGRPRILIMATQHGGERSGLLVISKFVKSLMLLRGTCLITPIINPLGLILRTREEPVERLDLNRSYPGSDAKDFSKRIAAKIFKLAKNCECIVDLHTFTRRDTKVLGVITRGRRPVSAKVNELMRAVGPDAVWEINYGRIDDKGFFGDIDFALSPMGVPVIGLEIPMEEKITDRDIDLVSRGIINILAEFKMTNTSSRGHMSKNIGIPVYTSEYLYATESGIFFPTKSVLARVNRGDRIGYIQSIPDFRSIVIRTPSNGTILSLYLRGFIRTGEKLASIGRKIRIL